MKDSNTYTKKFPTKKELKDESFLSKNFAKAVRYRLRVQEAKEAEKLIKEFKDDTQ